MGGPGSGRRKGGGKGASKKKTQVKTYIRTRVAKGKSKKNFVDKPFTPIKNYKSGL